MPPILDPMDAPVDCCTVSFRRLTNSPLNTEVRRALMPGPSDSDTDELDVKTQNMTELAPQLVCWPMLFVFVATRHERRRWRPAPPREMQS